MYNKSKSLFLYCLITSLALFSCLGGKDYVRSHTDLYKASGKDRINMLFSMMHIDEKQSWLLYEADARQFALKKKLESDSDGQTSVKVTFRLLRRFGGNVHRDTAVFIIKESLNEKSDKPLNGKWKIRLQQGYDWLMEIQVLDLISGKRGISFLEVNKSDALCAQNFELKNADSSFVFNPYVHQRKEVSFSYTRKKTAQKVQVDYFKNKFPAAAPAYAELKTTALKYEPDSSFYVAVVSGNARLKPEAKGIFHVRTDTSTKTGLSLLCTNADYPEINSPPEMFDAAVYLMKDDEFNATLSAGEKKKSMEKLWLKFGGSEERARSLSTTYFKRVKEANQHFTSYVEGWKSDRGMIWIIYGQPKLILKSVNTETWTYGTGNEPAQITFVFKKMKNVFSENDYALEREGIKPETWFKAVDNWRQGRVNFGLN